ncbi:hypothetical protein WDU94_004149 [Cyamophila willieti]
MVSGKVKIFINYTELVKIWFLELFQKLFGFTMNKSRRRSRSRTRSRSPMARDRDRSSSDYSYDKDSKRRKRQSPAFKSFRSGEPPILEPNYLVELKYRHRNKRRNK